MAPLASVSAPFYVEMHFRFSIALLITRKRVPHCRARSERDASLSLSCAFQPLDERTRSALVCIIIVS
jgi:hypothetical protein